MWEPTAPDGARSGECLGFLGSLQPDAIHPDSLKTSKELYLGKEVKAWLTGGKATYALSPEGGYKMMGFLSLFLSRTAKKR